MKWTFHSYRFFLFVICTDFVIGHSGKSAIPFNCCISKYAPETIFFFLSSRALSRGGVGGQDPSSSKVSVVCIFWHHPQFPHVLVHKIAPSPFGSASWSPSGDLHVHHLSEVAFLFPTVHMPKPSEPALPCFASYTPYPQLFSDIFTLHFAFTVTPLILLSILISVFSRIFSSFTPVVQHSAPYKMTGLTTVVYSSVFNFVGIFLSAISGPSSLHFCHTAFTLALTSVSDPPSSLKVTPRFLGTLSYACSRSTKGVNNSTLFS